MGLTMDAPQVETARSLERANTGWLIMWSPWRQAYTAFGCFAAEPIVVDDPSPDGLLLAMRQEELRHFYSSHQR